LSVEFCGLTLEHPVVNGSGTFDAIAARRVFGDALLERFPFSAFVSKTITLRPRAGNPPPRLYETAAGMLNSIGLPNKGLEGYLREDLPLLAELPVPLITNVMGSSADELVALVDAVGARDEIAAVELNVSCPNVKTGLDIGAVPAERVDHGQGQTHGFPSSPRFPRNRLALFKDDIRCGRGVGGRVRRLWKTCTELSTGWKPAGHGAGGKWHSGVRAGPKRDGWGGGCAVRPNVGMSRRSFRSVAKL